MLMMTLEFGGWLLHTFCRRRTSHYVFCSRPSQIQTTSLLPSKHHTSHKRWLFHFLQFFLSKRKAFPVAELFFIFFHFVYGPFFPLLGSILSLQWILDRVVSVISGESVSSCTLMPSLSRGFLAIFDSKCCLLLFLYVRVFLALDYWRVVRTVGVIVIVIVIAIAIVARLSLLSRYQQSVNRKLEYR